VKVWTGYPKEGVAIYDRLPEETRRLWGIRWQQEWLRAMMEDPRRVEPEVERVLQETTKDLKPTYTAILAIVRAREGRDFDDLEREALGADRRMGHFHHVFHFLAEARAVRRDVPRAAELLRLAAGSGMPCAICFDNDPLLAPIRGSKEYGDVRREIERLNAGYRAALKDVL
jgi:hypothetical protein